MIYLRPIPKNDAESLSLIRIERDRLLKETDWVVLRNLETNEQIPQSWLDYRQQLRDLPQTFDSIENINWPIKPEQ